jgi:hypothetical protein
MRALAILVAVSFGAGCTANEQIGVADHCNLRSKSQWTLLASPPTDAAVLLKIVHENPGMPGVVGPDLWLSHTNGDILLCRGNSDAGEKWIFRQREGHWESASEVEVWVVAK